MNNIPTHLSFSGIKEYCSDRQMFYKKYVLREWDNSTWFNTIVGSGVHIVIEDFYKQEFPNSERSISLFVQEQCELFKEGKVILNDENINDREKTLDVFKEELEMTISRIVPSAMEYINKKILFKMKGVEVKMQSQVGKAVGFTHTKMQLKGYVDAIAEDGVLYDWKTCSKFSPANKVEYDLQGINNALLYAEVEKKLPKSVVFVEFLNTPSNEDKVLEYEAKIAEWEKQKEAGEKVRKPSPPKLKENEERYREHIISLDKWKFQAYLELIDRITRELQGENLLALGLPIPSVEAKYGKYEGWQDFCTKLLGYNPYTGEVIESQDPLAPHLVTIHLKNVEDEYNKHTQTIIEDMVEFDESKKDPTQEKINQLFYGNSVSIPMTKEALKQKEEFIDIQEKELSEPVYYDAPTIEDFDDVAALEKVQAKQKNKSTAYLSNSLDSIIHVEI